MGAHYDQMIRITREVSDIGHAASVLSWDQETHMPRKGALSRGRQMAVLSTIAHSRFVSKEMGEAIRGAESEHLEAPQAVNLREIRRSYERKIKVPVELVRSLTETSSQAKEAWREAREKNEFPLFAPLLEKTVELKKRYAEAVGYETEPYDALMEDYEPGMTGARVEEVFGDLRTRLLEVARKISEAGNPPSSDFLCRHYPKNQQEAISRKVLELMGFDFDAGRMDISTHPFTTSFSPLDVRLTTRYDESFFPMAFFGTMHEGGHALYEQGLSVEHEGTPLADSVSLGIHESQSRMWENMVGRGRPFWKFFFPVVREAFPDALRDVEEEAFYRAINEAKPSLIRVEADEVYYNLHIMLRFEIERDIFREKLKPQDTPEAWKEGMREYVGITPKRDAEGVLQDIHWAMGIFGYFPTYALGNLYAAQLMAAARRQFTDLDERIGSGDLRTLLDWLRETIHSKGMTLRAEDLLEDVTGSRLDAAPFLDYLETKYGGIYRF